MAQKECKRKRGDIFNHELLQLGIIQQNVIVENHLVTGNAPCIVVFVFFLIGSSDSYI